jgi:hypothetical protein
MNPEERRDQFLSEEDLDLRNLSWDELILQWNAWLHAASATDSDDDEYEHGVFMKPRYDLLDRGPDGNRRSGG